MHLGAETFSDAHLLNILAMPDPFIKLGEVRHPAHAPKWPGKRILILKNMRNGTKNIIVLEPDGAVCACPEYLEGQVDQILKGLS